VKLSRLYPYHTTTTNPTWSKLVGTSRTDNDSTTNPENCQFLEIRGFRGRSVIGVLRILTNPEIWRFLAILGIRGSSVIGALSAGQIRGSGDQSGAAVLYPYHTTTTNPTNLQELTIFWIRG